MNAREFVLSYIHIFTRNSCLIYIFYLVEEVEHFFIINL